MHLSLGKKKKEGGTEERRKIGLPQSNSDFPSSGELGPAPCSWRHPEVEGLRGGGHGMLWGKHQAWHRSHRAEIVRWPGAMCLLAATGQAEKLRPTLS